MKAVMNQKSQDVVGLDKKIKSEKTGLQISVAITPDSQRPALKIFDIPIWNGTMSSAVQWIVSRAAESVSTRVGFVNANNLNIASNNRDLTRHYQDCDVIFADGAGVKLASRFKSNPIEANINGTDMLPHLCSSVSREKQSVFLLGASQGIANQAAKNLVADFPGLKVAGTHHGYLDNEITNQKVINQINRSGASILLVAMGTPLQENWLSRYESRLNVAVKISVGGLFDFYANKIKRAPLWMRKAGFEWGWRLAQEPRRMWRRYLLGNPLFLTRVAAESLLDYIKYSYSAHLKRVVDIGISGFLLLCLTPVFLMIAAAIKLETKGNAFYSQNRVGKDGKLFTFWKFRSMVVGAHQKKKRMSRLNESVDGVMFKMKIDPRVTIVGRFIRRFSLDELPQLWNVLRGNMSLVGPRPALPEEVMKYSSEDRKRLEVKPGLTCYWQISGRSELSFQQQVVLDKQYIAERSFMTDLLILIRTIPAVLSGRGAY